MAYDPNFPPDHQALNGAPFRNQFQGLKALIDARAHRVDDISGLGMNASLTYDPAQIQSIADKLDEVIDALNRA